MWIFITIAQVTITVRRAVVVAAATLATTAAIGDTVF